MKFINVMYFLISVNIAMFLTSVAGVWHPTGEAPLGANPTIIMAIFTGALGYMIGTGGAVVLAQKLLKLNVFSPEKSLGYMMIAGLYGSLTNLNASIVNTLEVNIGNINFSTIMNVVFAVIYLVFILQTIFGGFKSYE